MYHVRLTPYDKHSGALCQRLSLGGQLFEANKWYTVHPEQAEKLRSLKQKSGAYHFQIVESDEEWQKLVRQELAAAMAGPEAAVMAKFLSQQPQSLPPPKAQAEVIPSEFEGLTAAAVEDSVIGAAAAGDLRQPASLKGPPRRGTGHQADLLKDDEISVEKGGPKKESAKKAPTKKKSPPRRGGRKKKTT